jgi:hypothetical protein
MSESMRPSGSPLPRRADRADGSTILALPNSDAEVAAEEEALPEIILFSDVAALTFHTTGSGVTTTASTILSSIGAG